MPLRGWWKQKAGGMDGGAATQNAPCLPLCQPAVTMLLP